MKALASSRGLKASGLAARSSTAGRRSALTVRAAAAPVQEVLEGGSSGFEGEVPAGLNKFSGHITQPKSQGASQAMLYATGLREGDMGKPQVRGAARFGRMRAP